MPSSGVTAYGSSGEPFFYPLSATNSPTSYSVSSLPAGLSYDAAQQAILGTPTSAGTYTVNIAASNGAGTGSASLTLTVSAYAPSVRVASAAAAGTVKGLAFNYTVASNTPGSVYGYSASNLPSGLTFNSSTDVITGTPTASGIFTVPLLLSTYSGGTVPGNLTIAIDAAPTAPPVFTSPAAATGTVDAPASYPLAATNLPTAFTVANLPPGLSFDPSANVIYGTPTAAGTFSVPLTASNAAGTATAVFTLAIAAAPTLPPVLDTNSLAVAVSQGQSGTIYQTQATRPPVTYVADNLPPGLSLDPVNGIISGTASATGVYAATLSATNASGSGSVVVTFNVNAGGAPQFYSTPANLAGSVGSSLSQNFFASPGVTGYTAQGLPPGLYQDASSGTIFGVPTTAGTYATTLSATNSVGSTQAIVTFVIAATGSAPAFSGDDAAVVEMVGSSFYMYLSTSNNPTNYTVNGLPPGLSYSYSTYSGSIRGTPTATGVYPVMITATNAVGSASEVVTITINAPSAAPPLITSAAGAGGSVGAKFGYYISASNGPGSYGASGLPDGLAIDPSTGYLSGVPTTAGSYAVNLSAANVNGTASAVVTLQITAASSSPAVAPVITSAAAAGFAKSSTDSFYYSYESSQPAFTYTISAANSPTSFGAANLPVGLGLNPSTGVISGRPQAAGTFTIPITATNAAGTARAVLTLVAPLNPPQIQASLTTSGAVGSRLEYSIYTGNAYQEYYFFDDPLPADAPTFAAAGLPPGLSLDRAYGEITGTPTMAGDFPVTLTATNRAGSNAVVVTFAIAAMPPSAPAPSKPSFYGDAVAPGFVGVPMNFYLYGTGTSYTASGLPDGLSLDAASGRIVGTPTTAGDYAVPVTTRNAAGIASATLTIRVAAAPDLPIIDSGAGTNATVGTNFTYRIYTDSTDFTSTPTSYGADNLPPGLSFNSTSGILSGKPTQAGTYTVPISANCPGVSSHATLTLTVLPAPATPAAPVLPVFAGPAGAIGYLANPFAYAASLDGFTLDGALPDDFFDPATDTLSGYPGATGSTDIALSGVNAAGTGHAMLNLRFIEPQLSLPRMVVQPVGSTMAQGADVVLACSAAGVPAPVFRWTHDGTVVPGATGPELDLAAARPADAGIYGVTASNSSGSVTSATVTLNVLQTYSFWQNQSFSQEEIAVGLAAPGYDFNGDGLPNLLEYALNRDPRTGQGGNLPAGSKSAGGVLQIQFVRDSGKTGLDYVVESSPDLRAWTAIAQSAAGAATVNLGGAGGVSETNAGGGTVSVTVTDGQVSATDKPRFLRLRINGH